MIFWFWLYAMMGLLLALVLSLMAIDEDIAAQRDTKRDAWWREDPNDPDRGKRDNERPHIS